MYIFTNKNIQYAEKSDAEITEEGIKEELRQLKDMKNLIHQ